MGYAKVAINGYGTVGGRVADAVAAQDDMDVIGVVKTRPTFEARMAVENGFDLYVPDPDMIGAFEKAGIEVSGTLEELLDEAFIVVDCTPNNVGASYKDLYLEKGVRAIWQGGEDHDVAGFSFNAEANYDDAIGKKFARVVSCNTTGLARTIFPLVRDIGVDRIYATMIRRGVDPNDSKKGPVNAITPVLKVPSHHGPDLKTVIEGLFHDLT